jgi:hypothetical protein
VAVNRLDRAGDKAFASNALFVSIFNADAKASIFSLMTA